MGEVSRGGNGRMIDVKWINADVDDRLLTFLYDEVIEYFAAEVRRRGDQKLSMLNMQNEAKQRLGKYGPVDEEATERQVGEWNIVMGPCFSGAVSFERRTFAYFEMFDKAPSRRHPSGRTLFFVLLWRSNDQ